MVWVEMTLCLLISLNDLVSCPFSSEGLSLSNPGVRVHALQEETLQKRLISVVCRCVENHGGLEQGLPHSGPAPSQ